MEGNTPEFTLINHVDNSETALTAEDIELITAGLKYYSWYQHYQAGENPIRAGEFNDKERKARELRENIEML